MERLVVIRKMACRKLREARKRRVGVFALSQLRENYRRARKEVKKANMKDKKELRKRTVRKIREQGSTSCNLFWTDLRGKRKDRRERRMKDDEGRMKMGEDEVLEVMAKHWEEPGREREDTEAEMRDMDGHELVICEEVSCEEVVEVMKCLKRGKAAGPDGIMNEMLMYGSGWLVEVMLLMMNVVVKSECCPLGWKRSRLVPLHKDGDVEQVVNYRGIALGCSVVKVFVRVWLGSWGGLLKIGFLQKRREGLEVVGDV